MSPALSADPGEVTGLLREMAKKGGDAEERLFGLVYKDFLALARSYFRRQPHGHTLEPTAVVHEAYMRLVQQDAASYSNRNHFFAVGALVMRQILVNHAVAKGAKKRGGNAPRASIEDESIVFVPSNDADVLAVDDALKDLAKLNPTRTHAWSSCDSSAVLRSRRPRTCSGCRYER